MMSDSQRSEEIRRRVLDRMERSETLIKLAIIAAALVEALCLVLLIVLVDFKNPDHLVVLVAAVLVYVTLGLGLVALGGHVTRSTLRILKAIELAERGESHRS